MEVIIFQHATLSTMPVYGSRSLGFTEVFIGFAGQVTLFDPREGPCYRCLFPEPPPPDHAPSCAEAGVLGVLPGIIGLLQAVEVIKLVLGTGDTLRGKLLRYDALSTQFRTLRLLRDEACPACAKPMADA